MEDANEYSFEELPNGDVVVKDADGQIVCIIQKLTSGEGG